MIYIQTPSHHEHEEYLPAQENPRKLKGEPIVATKTPNRTGIPASNPMSKQVAQNRRSNSERPAVNLPTELLFSIFIFACFDGAREEPWIEKNGLRVVRHSINATCHRWRMAALACSPIWSIIYLVRTHHFSLPSVELLELELERSKSHPLDLHCYIDAQSYETIVKPILVENASRCKLLDLVMMERVPASPVISEPPMLMQLPALQYLAVGGALLGQLMGVFSAPNVSNLHIHLGLPFGPESTFSLLDFPLLRHVSVVGHGFGLGKLNLVFVRRAIASHPEADNIYLDLL